MTNTKELKQAKTAPKKKKKERSLSTVKSRSGWVFIAPFLVGFFLIYLPMIVESIQFSFNEIKILSGGGYQLNFVGWENYEYALFENADFVQTLLSSLGQLAFNVPAIVIFSLFVAVLLNSKVPGRAIFRAIFFIPVIVSTGIIESIDLQNSLADTMQSMSESASSTIGASSGSGQQTDQNALINIMDVAQYFNNMAVGKELVGYVVQVVNSVYQIINKSGVQMLIFLAGLQSISPAIYESCQIDGATSWETFWKITFPMISPMILVNTIYTVIDNFTSNSNTMMTFISKIYNDTHGTVRATAMAWIYFLIVIIILALVAALLSGYVFYQRRDK